MWNKSKVPSPRPIEIMGEVSALAEKLGSADLADLTCAGGVELNKVRSLPQLRVFLNDYIAHVLIRFELPSIQRAYQCGARSQARELIVLDANLQREPALENLARASQHVGRSQLRKLRPLRDQRVVQRYLAAVEKGEAKAWHTVVFGLVLALYALPLRQGLLHYTTQTLAAWVYSAARRLRLRPADCEALLTEVTKTVPQAIDELVRNESVALRLIK